jgi:enoyl-CoA hydratase/carnithine racemase
MSTVIEVTQADGVAELRFNRPEALNALNVPSIESESFTGRFSNK